MRLSHYRVQQHSSVARWIRGHGQHQPIAHALYRVPHRISCCGYKETSTFKRKDRKDRTNSHHGRLSFGLRLTESIQEWWLLDSAEQRGSRCAGTSWRPMIKIDGNRLTFEQDFRSGNKGNEAVFTPFAKTPSNCFFARVASAGVSNVMIATPDERPLRSY
jgi:hypothetical protein